MWKKWDAEKPKAGTKIVLVANDGCSSSTALAVDYDGKGTIHALDGEGGWDLTKDSDFCDGAIWVPLPENYALAFLEAD